MKNILLACAFLVLCCSCESLILHSDGGAGQYDGKAIIRDYCLGYEYEVLTIDKKPVDRVKHGKLVTRAPVIIVDPGSHTFGIQKRVSDFVKVIDLEEKYVNPEPILYVTANVFSGHTYFFNMLQGKYVLEEIESE